jgi:hypothetical protein
MDERSARKKASQVLREEKWEWNKKVEENEGNAHAERF